MKISIFASIWAQNLWDELILKNEIKLLKKEYWEDTKFRVFTYDKKNPFYLKLHYEGILGRVNREIPRIKAISGPELSRIISNSIDKNMLCEKLYLFKEFAARILFVKESKKEITLNNQSNLTRAWKELYKLINPNFDEELFNMCKEELIRQWFEEYK